MFCGESFLVFVYLGIFVFLFSSLACTMELFDKPGKLYSICSVVFLKPCARLNIFSGSGKKFQATRLKMHLLES